MDPVDLIDRLGWMVAGAIVALAVPKILSVPRRVKLARRTIARANLDWHKEREFLYRRMMSDIDSISIRTSDPSYPRKREQIVDSYADIADGLKTSLERKGEDAFWSLGILERIWWRISSLWSGRLLDQETELDSEGLGARWLIEELAQET